MIPLGGHKDDSSQNLPINQPSSATRARINRQGGHLTEAQTKEHLQQIELQKKTEGAAQPSLTNKVPGDTQHSFKAKPLTAEERQNASTLLQKVRSKIRKEKAEPKSPKDFKMELETVRNTPNPHVQRVLKQADAEKTQGRYHYKPSRDDDLERLGDFVVINGKKKFVAPKANISIKGIETVAQHLIAKDDREGLRRLCNVLFTGPYRSDYYSMRRKDVPEILALVALLNDPEAKLEGVEKLISGGAALWREKYKPPMANNINEGIAKLKIDHPKFADLPEAELVTYGNNPEAWIEISHGGGLDNIEDFLAGRSDGYPLETFGTGLQVSVNKNKGDAKTRDEGYSQGSYNFFDTPGTFTGRIQAKYLQRAGSSGAEAGLTPENVRHLQNREVVKGDFNPKRGVRDLPNLTQIEQLRKKYGEAIADQIVASTKKFKSL